MAERKRKTQMTILDSFKRQRESQREETEDGDLGIQSYCMLLPLCEVGFQYNYNQKGLVLK